IGRHRRQLAQGLDGWDVGGFVVHPGTVRPQGGDEHYASSKQLGGFDRLAQTVFASGGLCERRLGRPNSGERWYTEAPAIGFALVTDGGLAIPQASLLQDDVQLPAREPRGGLGKLENPERRLS